MHLSDFIRIKQTSDTYSCSATGTLKKCKYWLCYLISASLVNNNLFSQYLFFNSWNFIKTKNKCNYLWRMLYMCLSVHCRVKTGINCKQAQGDFWEKWKCFKTRFWSRLNNSINLLKYWITHLQREFHSM